MRRRGLNPSEEIAWELSTHFGLASQQSGAETLSNTLQLGQIQGRLEGLPLSESRVSSAAGMRHALVVAQNETEPPLFPKGAGGRGRLKTFSHTWCSHKRRTQLTSNRQQNPYQRLGINQAPASNNCKWPKAQN